MARLILALLASLAFAAPAGAAELLPPKGKVWTGVSGGTSLDPYASQVGNPPSVFGFFTMWGGNWEYIFDGAERTGTHLMIHIGTQRYYGHPEKVTPLGIARGEGDGYLVRLNRRIAEYGKPTYIRFLAEMNQANNGYSAFAHSGRAKGRSHSTRSFIAAWRRATLILRGGPVDRIDRRLARLGLPPVGYVAPGTVLPSTPIAMMWVPQTEGSPQIHANRPQAYWPGGRYVDWVGTDFYSKFPAFDKLERFYRAFPRKPFVFGEWALWGRDDPAFVRRLMTWVRSHKRVRILMYNQGKEAGGPFRLDRYPRARSELAAQLRAKVFD